MRYESSSTVSRQAKAPLGCSCACLWSLAQFCMWPVGAAATPSQHGGTSQPVGSPPITVQSGSSNGTTSAQSPSLHTAAPSNAPTPTVHDPSSTRFTGSEQQSAVPQTRTNGNGATASAASTSATDTVEHWVSDNLSSFLADPNADPDLPAFPETAGSQAQRAALERQGAPADTRRAGTNGSSAVPATNSKRPSSQQQQQLHKVQQLQQPQQQQQSDQQLWQQQQQERTGANGASKGARQSWGSVKQKGPSGAWQGRGQGPAGGTGGSWATVDPNMENARRLLSPWRSALHFCCVLYILLSSYQ